LISAPREKFQLSTVLAANASLAQQKTLIVVKDEDTALRVKN